MGGSSNPVKKVTNKVKDVVKKTKAETAGKVLGGIATGGIGAAAGAILDKTLDAKTGVITNPVGTIFGEAGEKFVDKPRAAKEMAKRLAKEAEDQNKKTLSDLRKRKADEDSAAESADKLQRKRRRQAASAKGGGRRSTILTDRLGEIGGQNSEGRKSILGV